MADEEKKPKPKIQTKLHQVRFPTILIEEFEAIANKRGVTFNDYLKFVMLKKVEEAHKMDFLPKVEESNK